MRLPAPPPAFNPFSAPSLLLLFGSAGLYVASRASADALAGGARAGAADSPGAVLPSPGLLALGHWFPVVAVAGVATWHGLPQVALGVVFGSSVAALSLAMGLVTYLSPPASLPASRRAWPLIVAGALVPLLAGFDGRLTAADAGLMLLLGAVVWSLWRGTAERNWADVLASAAATPAPPGGADPAGGRPADYARTAEAPRAPWLATRLRLPEHFTMLGGLQWLLAFALAIVGARAVVLGTAAAEASSRLLPATLLSAAVLSPVLVLPILASGTDLAHRGRSPDAAASLVALAMLNLFALLPVVILLGYMRSAAPHGPVLAALTGAVSRGQPVPMPPGVWRIDAVVLTVLGFAMVPVALGRWTIDRLESAALIVAYAGYLAATAYSARLSAG